MAKKSAAKQPQKVLFSTEPAEHEAVLVGLSSLHFDNENPRFGSRTKQLTDETEILDTIVDEFGVDDVLSSISINGYLDTEPLVGVKENDGVKIVEGNRRLAACLILADDPRAKNQKRRVEAHRNPLRTPLRQVPIVIYKKDEVNQQLLPYLGVRHIVGTSEWDSYAKAAWIVSVIRNNELSLQKIRQMIGDKTRAVPRFVEGYYVIEQLQNAGRFNPNNSLKPGRGSNSLYPFSWVYTALGYRNIRTWLGLTDDGAEPRENPIPKDRLDNGRLLMNLMFGNRGDEPPRNPAVADSRELGKLAGCIAETRMLHMLKQGRSVQEAFQLSLAPADRLQDALTAAHDSLRQAWEIIGSSPLDADTANRLQSLCKELKNVTQRIHKACIDAMAGDDEDHS